MQAENTLAQVGRAFHDGSLADSVVVALARASAGRPLNSEDVASLKAAFDFLERAREGYEWVKAPRISQQSKAAAVSFETAVHSRYPQRHEVEFEQELSAMLETLRTLQSTAFITTPANSERLQGLRAFFYRILRSSIGRMDEILSPHEPQRATPWTLASRSRD
jgi:hypothetical protein